MKRTNDRLGLITLIIVAISIPVTLIILRSGNLDFRFQAFLSDEPRNVVVSDVKSDSFQVNWTTEKAVTGGIKVLDVSGQPLIVYGEGGLNYHSVQLANLNPDTIYNFVILSDGIEYDLQASPYIARTSSVNQTDVSNFLIYGQVFSSNGVNFQQGGLITLQFRDGADRSQVVATTLNAVGGYQFNLKDMANEKLLNRYNYLRDVDTVLTVYLSDGTESTERIFTINLSNLRQLPNFYLGDISVDTIPGIDGIN